MKTTDTARVVLTFQCVRDCAYCCNKFPRIQELFQPITAPKEVKEYRSVCLSGGEPMVFCPALTICWASVLKGLGVQTVYTYISSYNRLDELAKLVTITDGLSYTIHEDATEADVQKFLAFKKLAMTFKTKSFRLCVAPKFNHLLDGPEFWTRHIELTPQDNGEIWIADEDVYVLDGAEQKG